MTSSLINALSSFPPMLASAVNQGLFIAMLIAVILVFVFGLFYISDKMLALGADTFAGNSKANYSLIPRLRDRIWQPPVNAVAEATGLTNIPFIKLKKGFDILIEGKADMRTREYVAATCAVNPKDINGLAPIPKFDVEEGDEVLAGSVLFYDKKNTKVKFTAPVSGEVVEIRRGEKRSIEDVVILADKEIRYKAFDTSGYGSMDRERIVALMLESGLWPLIRQRPYNDLAEYDEVPRDIFISAFDSAPLAPDLNYTLWGEAENFQAGIDILAKLTDGAVHLGLDARSRPADLFLQAENVRKYWFEGKHPSGNVGIQIHHIDPILKNDIVWTAGAEDVATIGRFFREGKYDPVRTVAVVGPEVKEPQYFRTRLGANIAGLLEDNLEQDHVRIISGDVLTGNKVDPEKGHLGYFENQVTVVEEGDRYEMFGWLLPSYMRPSLSRTFPAAWLPNYRHKVNTNTHGEHRAFVVTGQYESVLPMNLYPQHLLKSILANDIDRMEGLGIYEVVEEDLALCEFVCTSKQDVQYILRDGIEYLKEQL